MTREQVKAMLPIMQAFAEGKAVEYLNDEKRWVECGNLSFWDDPKYYRIKPEPKYRPFKTKEECWEEMLKHQPFGWVRDKDGNYSRVLSVRDEKEDFINRFETAIFIDGTPFGIEE